MKDRLFIGNFSTGIVYADRAVEVRGDYKRIAFLSYSTLKLEINAPRSPLLSQIREHAAGIQGRLGEDYQVSACGQTVTLGHGLTDKG